MWRECCRPCSRNLFQHRSEGIKQRKGPGRDGGCPPSRPGPFLCLSGDGRVLFVTDNGEITKHHLVTGKVDKVLGLPADYSVYRSSADGKYLAATTADYWDRRERDLGRNFIRVADTT